MTVLAHALEVYGPESFGPSAARAIAGAIRETVETRGTCSFCLTGGTTPRPVYAELARITDLPWKWVDVYFGDERAVAPSHPRSNYGMAFRWLLRFVPIPPERVHRLEGERADFAQAAREYEQALPITLDVLLLGVGVDGHVASLFPRSPVLREDMRRVLPVTAPLSAERRLTITPRVIHEARTVFVLARGHLKARPVRMAFEPGGTVMECPARLASSATWILDREAASELEERSMGYPP